MGQIKVACSLSSEQRKIIGKVLLAQRQVVLRLCFWKSSAMFNTPHRDLYKDLWTPKVDKFNNGNEEGEQFDLILWCLQREDGF